AGLMQTLEAKHYSEIIMTRVTVPVGEDIGFLPGTEEEKMAPWMGALEDNLDVLNKTDEDAGEWGRAATRDLIRSRIKIKSCNSKGHPGGAHRRAARHGERSVRPAEGLQAPRRPAGQGRRLGADSGRGRRAHAERGAGEARGLCDRSRRGRRQDRDRRRKEI